MKKLRACLLLALFGAAGSYGLVFGTCAVNPRGSCSILGLNPLQVEVTSGDNPADPSSAIF
jgi:hypothetical protein